MKFCDSFYLKKMSSLSKFIFILMLYGKYSLVRASSYLSNLDKLCLKSATEFKQSIHDIRTYKCKGYCRCPGDSNNVTSLHTSGCQLCCCYVRRIFVEKENEMAKTTLFKNILKKTNSSLSTCLVENIELDKTTEANRKEMDELKMQLKRSEGENGILIGFTVVFGLLATSFFAALICTRCKKANCSNSVELPKRCLKSIKENETPGVNINGVHGDAFGAAKASLLVAQAADKYADSAEMVVSADDPNPDNISSTGKRFSRCDSYSDSHLLRNCRLKQTDVECQSLM